MLKNVLDLLERDARIYGEKPALRMRNDVVSFSELRQKSRLLGQMLVDMGVSGRRPVAVFAERDVKTPILFFATLYSDNYYVPIDPEMPTDKIRTILDDAACPIVLGVRRSSFTGKNLDAWQCLSLDDLDPNGKMLGEIQGGDQDPLYMVYTSGSTGKPKGVVKSHAAEISFIDAYVETFGFSSEDVIGNQTPFFFDASGKDLYLMLRTGATMDIIPIELFMMPPALIEYLNAHAVSFISWVPSALVIVSKLNTFTYVKPTSLKRVFFVGEIMPVKHLKKWMDALPNVEFVNLYGSSEIAGIACYYRVPNVLCDDCDVLPMGKPLSNCRTFLCNEHGIVRECGVTGEIVITSDALAEGYFNDPVRTRERFVEMSVDGVVKRCLKTGDLAQVDCNGNYVFVSRNDFQIKHMGHRIELGEIETMADKLGMIERCCCLYDFERTKIVLFCELTKGSAATAREITTLLRDRLSAYMVPGKVVVMDALPLNANGKIDRQKLKQTL